MEPVLKQVEKKGYKVQRIDVDQNPRLAKRYGVTSVPTYIVVRDGNIIERRVGAVKLRILIRMLSP